MEAAGAFCERSTGVRPRWMPATPVAATGCPPLGVWTLRASAPACHASERPDVFTVAASVAMERPPLVELPGPILAAGLTDSSMGPPRLLRVTEARSVGDACMVKLQIEYVGPHEFVENIVEARIVGGHLAGTGTYRYLADDCRAPDPADCECEAPLALAGELTRPA